MLEQLWKIKIYVLTINQMLRIWFNEFRALLELIAGKNRANTAMAILSNTKDLEEAYESSINSAGKWIAWIHRNMYDSTDLNPVTPKALLLQYRWNMLVWM